MQQPPVQTTLKARDGASVPVLFPWELSHTDYIWRIIAITQDIFQPTYRLLTEEQGVPRVKRSGGCAVEDGELDPYYLMKHVKQYKRDYATQLGQSEAYFERVVEHILSARNKLAHLTLDDSFSGKDVEKALSYTARLATGSRVKHVQENVFALEQQFEDHMASQEQRLDIVGLARPAYPTSTFTASSTTGGQGQTEASCCAESASPLSDSEPSTKGDSCTSDDKGDTCTSDDDGSAPCVGDDELASPLRKPVGKGEIANDLGYFVVHEQGPNASVKVSIHTPRRDAAFMRLLSRKGIRTKRHKASGELLHFCDPEDVGERQCALHKLGLQEMRPDVDSEGGEEQSDDDSSLNKSINSDNRSCGDSVEGSPINKNSQVQQAEIQLVQSIKEYLREKGGEAMCDEVWEEVTPAKVRRVLGKSGRLYRFFQLNPHYGISVQVTGTKGRRVAPKDALLRNALAPAEEGVMQALIANLIATENNRLPSAVLEDQTSQACPQAWHQVVGKHGTLESFVKANAFRGVTVVAGKRRRRGRARSPAAGHAICLQLTNEDRGVIKTIKELLAEEGGAQEISCLKKRLLEEDDRAAIVLGRHGGMAQLCNICNIAGLKFYKGQKGSSDDGPTCAADTDSGASDSSNSAVEQEKGAVLCWRFTPSEEELIADMRERLVDAGGEEVFGQFAQGLYDTNPNARAIAEQYDRLKYFTELCQHRGVEFISDGRAGSVQLNLTEDDAALSAAVREQLIEREAPEFCSVLYEQLRAEGKLPHSLAWRHGSFAAFCCVAEGIKFTRVAGSGEGTVSLAFDEEERELINGIQRYLVQAGGSAPCMEVLRSVDEDRVLCRLGSRYGSSTMFFRMCRHRNIYLDEGDNTLHIRFSEEEEALISTVKQALIMRGGEGNCVAVGRSIVQESPVFLLVIARHGTLSHLCWLARHRGLDYFRGSEEEDEDEWEEEEEEEDEEDGWEEDEDEEDGEGEDAEGEGDNGDSTGQCDRLYGDVADRVRLVFTEDAHRQLAQRIASRVKKSGREMSLNAVRRFITTEGAQAKRLVKHFGGVETFCRVAHREGLQVHNDFDRTMVVYAGTNGPTCATQ